MRRRAFSFGGVAPGSSMAVEVARGVDVGSMPVGSLMVRVHSSDVGANSDGSVRVVVRPDGRTAQDPAALFTGSRIAQVLAVDASTTAPRYVVRPFPTSTSRLVVEVEGAQDTTTSDTLDVELSLSLVVRELPRPVLAPNEIPNLEVSLTESGIHVRTGVSVDKWTDSVNGYVFLRQSVPAEPDIVVADSDFNGRDSVAFGGGANYKVLRHSWSNTPTWSEGTGVVVAVSDGADPPSSPADAGLWRWGLGTRPVIPSTSGVVQDNFGSSARVDLGTSSEPFDQPFIYSARVSSADLEARMNGALVGAQSSITPGWTSLARIGASNDTSSWLGRVAALFVFSRRLDDLELDALGRWISLHYGAPWRGL